MSNFKLGDILAFDNNDPVGRVIKRASGGNVTHVAFVLDEHSLVESTMLDDSDPQDGVNVKTIQSKIDRHDGTIWHLPLKYNPVNVKEVIEIAKGYVGIPYDKVQAAMSALDIFLDAKEDFNAFFCSELCVALLQKTLCIKSVVREPILPSVIVSSEVTPVDLCRLSLYNGFNLLKGKGVIKRFNSMMVKDFNEF